MNKDHLRRYKFPRKHIPLHRSEWETVYWAWCDNCWLVLCDRSVTRYGEFGGTTRHFEKEAWWDVLYQTAVEHGYNEDEPLVVPKEELLGYWTVLKIWVFEKAKGNCDNALHLCEKLLKKYHFIVCEPRPYVQAEGVLYSWRDSPAGFASELHEYIRSAAGENFSHIEMTVSSISKNYFVGREQVESVDQRPSSFW